MSNKPFLLHPAVKDYLWGGERLKYDYGKQNDVTPLAETWECSTHKDGQSTVKSGEYMGMQLGEVLRLHPEYLGSHPLSINGGLPELPIMVKFIDAKQDLSIQVHPDDDYARTHENGQFGKTEMWYILHAKKGAELTYGFLNDIKPEEVKEAISNGTLLKYLQHIPVKKNDVFFIEPGTVHAIGEGIVIVEIQESSNLTYRLYDYSRTDRYGNKRELHIDKALDVARLSASPEPRQPLRVLKYTPGCAIELLCSCKYFQVERMLLNTEINRDFVGYSASTYSFQVLLCIEGCGILMDDDFTLPFFKGDCIFVPADSKQMRLHGKAQLLSIRS